MRITEYDLTSKYSLGITVAHVSDTHGIICEKFLPLIRKISPDIIAVSGDVFEYLAKDPHLLSRKNRRALKMLYELSSVAPVYMSLGNHDNGGAGAHFLVKNTRVKRDPTLPVTARELIAKSGCTLLDNEYRSVRFKDKTLIIGGFTSGMSRDDRTPLVDWLSDLERESGADLKLLLCHHPEYVQRYVKDALPSADVILSGHAHGAQMKLFGRGLYAPCQGFFPKYFEGVHTVGNSWLVISRGMKNTLPIVPRLFNPCEIVKILL